MQKSQIEQFRIISQMKSQNVYNAVEAGMLDHTSAATYSASTSVTDTRPRPHCLTCLCCIIYCRLKRYPGSHSLHPERVSDAGRCSTQYSALCSHSAQSSMTPANTPLMFCERFFKFICYFVSACHKVQFGLSKQPERAEQELKKGALHSYGMISTSLRSHALITSVFISLFSIHILHL